MMASAAGLVAVNARRQTAGGNRVWRTGGITDKEQLMGFAGARVDDTRNVKSEWRGREHRCRELES